MIGEKNENNYWLESVPQNWEIIRCKYLFQEISDLSAKGDELLLTVSHLTGITPRSEKNVNMFFAETMEGYKKCIKGDLIINTMWAWMGAVGTTAYDGICSPAYNIYRSRKNKPYDYKYFDYLFRTNHLIKEMAINSKGIVSSRLRLYPKELYQILIPLPSLSEQTQIAQYLDTKTQNIDKTINLLTQKTTSYKELRKTIINNAVTKGLNKNIELKESGIHWIGKIPNHWEIKRFKDIVKKYTTGGTPLTSNHSYFNGENVWICISDIGESKFVSNSSIKLTDEAVKSANMMKTPKGSLLYSFKLSIGKMAFVTDDVYTNEAILSIFPNKKFELEFYYFMLPILMYLQATENIYGAKMLNQKLISNAFILHPPKNEQEEIADYLEKKTNVIDKIISNIQNQIETLKELRKTLINDVVTGKVRIIKN